LEKFSVGVIGSGYVGSIAREYDYEPLLLDATAEVNERQRRSVIGKLQKDLLTLKIAFDPYEAIKGAHAVVVITEWEEVRNLDLARTATLMANPKLLVDGRNVFEPSAARECGLLYRGFGRA
jgi:UDPglucose 6-dehydrogenase